LRLLASKDKVNKNGYKVVANTNKESNTHANKNKPNLSQKIKPPFTKDKLGLIIPL